MIKWEKVENDLSIKLNDWFWINRIGIENIAKNLSKYFKDLIAKEFKLVARGKVDIQMAIDNPYGDEYVVGEDVLDLEEYKGKNISIYIREE